MVPLCQKQKTNRRFTAAFINMKTRSKLALSLGLLVAPLALVAESTESAYVASYRGRTDIPVPLTVVMPRVSSRYAGQTVTLKFVVDTAGHPTLIASATPGADSELVEAVTAALAQWKFSPALVDGRPVARRVVLPLTIADEFSTVAVN